MASQYTRSPVCRRYRGIASLTLLFAVSCQTDPTSHSDPPAPEGPQLATALPAVTLVGAGNLARCGTSTDEGAAALLDRISGTVFTTGDNVYDTGSASDYSNCYTPSWGRHKSRTRPSPGETDYRTSNASGYFGYFGSAAGPAGQGYYSYDVGAWHIIVLNSNIAMNAGSAQEKWLRADLAANGKSCTLAYWHHPRFSSYGTSVRDEVKPLWDALYQAGADIVLNGHYRLYERFAPQTPDGKADATRGIRQFTVGTGGQGTDATGSARPNSQVRAAGVYGVLRLTLDDGTYSWQFVRSSGTSFSDSGSGTCHGPTGTSSGTIASISITPASATVAVGGSATLTAVAKDAAGNVLSGQTMTWTTADAKIATVAAGLVTGVAAGTVAISASAGGKTAQAAVTVASATTNTSSTVRAGYYAAPNGSSSGDGSIGRPWSLATALSGGNGRVQPGDTIWLRGGRYTGGLTSTVTGRAGAPVVVRQYPGERAMIDGASSSGSTLQVRGSHSVFWGFELYNSNPTRSTSSTSNGTRANTLVNNTSNTKYINLVVHDGGVAFYNYTTAANVELYGSIFYNNGWQGPDRGHGHAIYLKSDVGPVVASENVMFNQFGYGVHAYTNGGSGKLNNILLERNVAFNNGTLSTNSNSANILVGGDDYATGDVLRDNYTYFTPGVGGTNVQVGYGSMANGDMTIQGNYFVGGSPVLSLGYWSRATVSGNLLLGASRIIALNDRSLSGWYWGSNQHHRDPSTSSWQYAGTSYSLSSWKSKTGLGSSDAGTSSQPTATKIVALPNRYEPGRATVVVYNWARQGAVSVYLGGAIPSGAQYEVRNVQNLFGAPVASGTYTGGGITIPMGGVTPPTPIGMSSSRAPRTGPAFDVFLITSR